MLLEKMQEAQEGSTFKDATTGEINISAVAASVLDDMVKAGKMRKWKEGDLTKASVLNAHNKVFFEEMLKVAEQNDKVVTESKKLIAKGEEAVDKAISSIAVPSVEFMLKDEGDTNFSQLEFNLADTNIEFNDVDYLEVVTTGLNFTNNSYMYMYALDSSKNVLSGYMGYTQHRLYGSTSRNAEASHNSNNSYIWFPTQSEICAKDYGYYGGGMNMEIKIPIRPMNRNGYKGNGVISYVCSGWDTSCSTYPQRQTGQWSNYSNQSAWRKNIYGIRLWGSGNFYNGTVKVVVHFKPKKVGE